jgi:hypothetical protein
VEDIETQLHRQLEEHNRKDACLLQQQAVALALEHARAPDAGDKLAQALIVGQGVPDDSLPRGELRAGMHAVHLGVTPDLDLRHRSPRGDGGKAGGQRSDAGEDWHPPPSPVWLPHRQPAHASPLGAGEVLRSVATALHSRQILTVCSAARVSPVRPQR